MANRYEESYAFQGDQNQENIGDATFVGIDQKTDDPGAMQPGFCRNLQNARINNGSLVTRDGMVPLASFNQSISAPIYGVGIFSDPASLEYMLIAVGNGVWALRNGQIPQFISVGSVVINAPVQLIQSFGNVTMFRGSTMAPLYWNGNLINGLFQSLPTPTVPNTQIPNGAIGTYAYSRLWVPYGKSKLAASNIGIFYQYDPIFGSLNIDSGRDDNLVVTVPWIDNHLICGKAQSVYLLSNAAGDLGAPPAGSSVIDTAGLPSLQCLISGVGFCGPRAYTNVGTDIWFMSQQGVYSVSQKIAQSPQVSSVPISDYIKPTIAQINWNAGSGIVAVTRKERVYFAVPIGNDTRNNSLIVYNLVTNAWESVDTFDPTQNFHIDDLYLTDYLGDRRIFAVDRVAGIVLMLEEGPTELYYTSVANAVAAGKSTNERQIQFNMLSRGLSGSGDRSNFKRTSINMATWNSNISVSLQTNVPGEVFNLVSNMIPSGTSYDVVGRNAFVTNNQNNDAATPYRGDYSMRLPFYLNGTAGTPQQGLVLQTMREKTYRWPSRLMARYAQVNITSTSGQVAVRNFTINEVEAERATRSA